MATPSAIRKNLESVRLRIAAAAARAGRPADSVRLIAVTKMVGLAEIRALYELGVRDFGESRAQEAAPKLEAMKGLGITWHFIGPLQTNKINKVLGAFALIHSVDRLALAQALSAHAARREMTIEGLLEVNVSGEKTKSGFAPEELEAAAREIRALPNLHVTGLMTMAPLSDSPEAARPVFAVLRRLRDRLAGALPLTHLSMGMTQDFEIAVEEGADMVRVGTALFQEE